MAHKDGLKAYWDLDESSGNAIDSHTGGHDGTDNNTVGTSATGGPGGGRCRDLVAANNEYFDVTHHADLTGGNSDWTIGGWGYSDDLSTTRSLMAKRTSSGGTDNEYEILWFDSKLQFFIGDGSTSFGTGISHGGISTATWYFWLAWHNSGTSKLHLSEDDSEATAVSHGITPGTSTAGVALGNLFPTTPTLPWEGRMQFWGKWSQIVASGDRTSLYNSGSGVDYASLTGASPSVLPWWYYAAQCRGMSPEDIEYEWAKFDKRRCELGAARRRDTISFKERKRWVRDPKTGMFTPPVCGIITPRLFLGEVA